MRKKHRRQKPRAGDASPETERLLAPPGLSSNTHVETGAPTPDHSHQVQRMPTFPAPPRLGFPLEPCGWTLPKGSAVTGLPQHHGGRGTEKEWGRANWWGSSPPQNKVRQEAGSHFPGR